MNRNKKIMILCTLALLFSMVGCSNPKESSSTIVQDTYECIKYSDMDTPYTMCFQNTDGTYSMFIYAAPVQYYDGKMYQPIDNTIIESNYKDFIYENKANSIKTYFPQKLNDEFLIKNDTLELYFCIDTQGNEFANGELTDYKNIYGQDIQAICYKSNVYSLYLYSSNAGIEIETVSEKGIKGTPGILISYDNDYGKSRENYNNGYIALRRGNGFNDIDAIIYGPLSKSDNKYDIGLTPNIKQVDEKQWRINYDLNKSERIVNQSIVLYTSNMPDSCVYSNSKQNQYLSRFAYVGNSELLGEGLDYLRYRLDYYLYLIPDSVIDASYNFKLICDADTDKFVVNENLDQWSSTGLTWRKRNTKFSQIQTNCTITDNNIYSINITDYAKKCFADDTWMTESYGLTIGYNGDMQMIATSDNAMFVPYLQINLSALPEGFYPMADINPDQE